MEDADPATGGAVDRLLADLAIWAGDERARDAAAARTRERWLHQQAAEAATFVGTALDLAERGVPVTVRTAGGRAHHGTIAAVGQDFLVVRGQGAAVTLLALAAIASLRVAPVSAGSGRASRSTPEPTGDRAPARGITLGQTLAALAATRPPVRIVTTGDEPVLGELRAVGDDVVTVRVDTQPPSHVYCALASVEECTVFGSG